MLHLSINELHKQFLTKSLLPSSVIRQTLNRIDNLSDLNIFVTKNIYAIKEAHEADKRYENNNSRGLLDGQTVAVKDNFCTKGLKTSCGSVMLDNFISPYNATVVQKCIDTGGVIIGKTNLDEFAMGSGTIDSYIGPTKNVWGGSVPYKLFDSGGAEVGGDRDHAVVSGDGDWLVAGGSSGGSAVAVASGVAMAALGSDTGGSVRIPAAWTGTASIKPSYGRLSRHGLIPLVNSLDCPGLITRSVSDLAIMMNIVQGRDIMDSTSVESDNIDMTPLDNVRGLRIGIPQEFHCEGMSEEVLQAWSEVASLLDNAGASVVPVSLPHTHLAIPCYSVLNPCEVASNMSRYDGLQYGLRGEGAGTEDLFADGRAKGFNEVVRGRILAGNYFLLRKQYKQYFEQALKIRRMIRDDYLRVWEDVDVLLTPVTLSPPPTFSNFSSVDNRTQTATQDFCTQPMNLAGVPALTLPVALSHQHLPISLQLVAPWLQDHKLLQLATWIESQVNFPTLVIDDELLEAQQAEIRNCS